MKCYSFTTSLFYKSWLFIHMPAQFILVIQITSIRWNFILYIDIKEYWLPIKFEHLFIFCFSFTVRCHQLDSYKRGLDIVPPKGNPKFVHSKVYRQWIKHTENTKRVWFLHPEKVQILRATENNRILQGKTGTRWLWYGI